MHSSNEHVESTYAEKTFGDRSRLKRGLQARRLVDAVDLARELPPPRRIVDFGAGNGELCKLLAQNHPTSEIYCFEPHPGLLQQARDNLAHVSGVVFAEEFEELPAQRADLVFCLEVFEHLPGQELEQALARIRQLLAPDGCAVIGVPVEVGIPALFKGLFRMLRRFGEFDARPGNVLLATLGRPPRERPEVELMPGSFYHLHHLGFDHRVFRKRLRETFTELGSSTSPARLGGSWLNAELTLLLKQ